ncbi:hypothetical protein BD410DRAFT_168735 [Rickenella mellea]|uniref:Uncharacterized protein n=1 Tax=Rickenella mellea TaxID=50990 RepID=A0A4Y7PJH9_9AGAM|nr:hypothetical protein BD410DRAFT_168735 [Rickenella mellea]
MGGFMLFDGDKALYILSPEKLKRLSEEGKIDFPKITKQEIEDRSKGDVISKGFMMIQTRWFVLQCIARGVERLAITELELVTLAFAVLNLVTYTLWWNKPLNVRCPVSVHLVPSESPNQPEGNEEFRVPSMFKRATQWMIETWDKHSVFLLILPFGRMVFGDWRGVTSGATNFQTFCSGRCDGYGRIIALSSIAIAMIFGALHCIAWSFQFPSHEMGVLWRTCSLLITCLPLTMVLYERLVVVVETLGRGSGSIMRVFVGMSDFMIPVTYVIARIILLIEAFLLLTSLPPGAFQTIRWTTFIPHV